MNNKKVPSYGFAIVVQAGTKKILKNEWPIETKHFKHSMWKYYLGEQRKH